MKSIISPSHFNQIRNQIRYYDALSYNIKFKKKPNDMRTRDWNNWIKWAKKEKQLIFSRLYVIIENMNIGKEHK